MLGPLGDVVEHDHLGQAGRARVDAVEQRLEPARARVDHVLQLRPPAARAEGLVERGHHRREGGVRRLDLDPPVLDGHRRGVAPGRHGGRRGASPPRTDRCRRRGRRPRPPRARGRRTGRSTFSSSISSSGGTSPSRGSQRKTRSVSPMENRSASESACSETSSPFTRVPFEELLSRMTTVRSAPNRTVQCTRDSRPSAASWRWFLRPRPTVKPSRSGRTCALTSPSSRITTGTTSSSSGIRGGGGAGVRVSMTWNSNCTPHTTKVSPARAGAGCRGRPGRPRPGS